MFHISDIGDVPPTPATPLIDDLQTKTATETLLSFAILGGFPISYKQEQGGRLIQNIVPVQKTEYEQISTSSKNDLYLHTETAFHPYKPSFVFLLCMRGDESVATTIASVNDIIEKLDDETISQLKLPDFTTGIDESFKDGKNDNFSLLTPVLRDGGEKLGDLRWTMTFDWQLMKGITKDASLALLTMKDAINSSIENIILRSGDLLVIDNNRAVHGRSKFQPRYDGTDRWLKRLLTIKHMPPKQHVDGTTIITEFGNVIRKNFT
jgi:hypothetical protein